MNQTIEERILRAFLFLLLVSLITTVYVYHKQLPEAVPYDIRTIQQDELEVVQDTSGVVYIRVEGRLVYSRYQRERRER